MLGYIGAYEALTENNVHMGNTFEINQTVYRQLGRDRRKVNAEVVTERDAGDNEIGSLKDVSGPFITYYLDRPSLSPGAQALYDDFRKEGLELDWETKQALATLILRRLKELRQ